MARFGFFWVVLARVGSFWLVSGCFDSFWVVLACCRSLFDSCWLVLGCFGSLWLVLGVLLARFALFWVVLAHFGSFRLVLGRYLCSYWPNIMQSSSTFIRISGFIPEVKKKKKKKKSALINYLENIAYWEESEQSEALTNKFVLLQIQLGGSRGSRKPRKILQLLPSFKLGNSISSA